MNDKRKQLGYRIRQARKEKGLSQLQLSEKIQISPSHMSDIESGKKNLGIDIFIRLVQELGASADWLLQTDTPHVSAVMDQEISSLLSDCSVSEKQLILKMARDMKEGLRSERS